MSFRWIIFSRLAAKRKSRGVRFLGDPQTVDVGLGEWLHAHLKDVCISLVEEGAGPGDPKGGAVRAS